VAVPHRPFRSLTTRPPREVLPPARQFRALRHASELTAPTPGTCTAFPQDSRHPAWPVGLAELVAVLAELVAGRPGAVHAPASGSTTAISTASLLLARR
jgi:hypothetical protein